MGGNPVYTETVQTDQNPGCPGNDSGEQQLIFQSSSRGIHGSGEAVAMVLIR